MLEFFRGLSFFGLEFFGDREKKKPGVIINEIEIMVIKQQNLSNSNIHTFSELEFSEHLGNEANGQAFSLEV